MIYLEKKMYKTPTGIITNRQSDNWKKENKRNFQFKY